MEINLNSEYFEPARNPVLVGQIGERLLDHPKLNEN